jgi:hypothetical protein
LEEKEEKEGKEGEGTAGVVRKGKSTALHLQCPKRSQTTIGESADGRNASAALAPNPGHSGISACQLAADIVSSHRGEPRTTYLTSRLLMSCFSSTGLSYVALPMHSTTRGRNPKNVS